MSTNVSGDCGGSRTYHTEVQSGSSDHPVTVCGLEITFETLPQEIDIKLLSDNRGGEDTLKIRRTSLIIILNL